MGLEHIPVVAVPADAGLTGNAAAVLREIAALLARLTDSGEGGAIDLTALPLTPADRDWLAAQLGRGEVEITLHTGGESTLQECAYPGVWWVRHHNEAGVLVSELIEVCHIPEIVPAHPADIKSGLERLNIHLDDLN